MRFFALLTTLSVTAVLCVGADTAATYQQALDLAKAQEKESALGEYSRQSFAPVWQQRMNPIFQACFKSVQQPDTSSFAFVAAIGPDGTVLRVYSDHETNMYQCMAASLKGEQFAAPPESPYYKQITMRFAPPPPASAWPKGSPPLVVEPYKYSYTFGVPAGWEFNFEQGYERGSSLVYFPKGGSFVDSGSVVYVNVFGDDCSGSCINLLPESMSQVLRSMKGHNSDAQIEVAEPVVTKDGVEAPIRLLRRVKDLRDPEFSNNEAVAFIAHNETIILVVLASRDPKAWEQDYAAFRQIVAGHMFFPCDLTVPCKK